MPSVNFPKACFRSVEKKIPNSVGARTQPCFTPLRMLKGSEMAPSYKTVLHDAEYDKGTPDLEKAISAHKVECLCYVNEGNIKWLFFLSAFSCSRLSEKIMSMVALLL